MKISVRLLLSMFVVMVLLSACHSRRLTASDMQAKQEHADKVIEQRKEAEEQKRQEVVKGRQERQSERTKKQAKKFRNQADEFNDRNKECFLKRWFRFKRNKR